MIGTEFGDLIAERLCAEHQLLATRWFDRLLDLLPVDARDVFPSDSLLDHIPQLIVEVGTYLREPSTNAIASNTSVLAKARELGALRHEQRASLHQLLREYQVLNGVLVTFVVEEMERLGIRPSAADTATLVCRLHHAIDTLSQATVEAFVSLYTETIAEQRERLEQFTRMAAHEWRQPLGALQFGTRLLAKGELDPARTARTLAVVERNVMHLVELTRKLEAVARIHDLDSLLVQEVSAATVASEAARQLREMAETHGVAVLVGNTLPTLTVDVGRLELAFVNLLSNGIKYCDPAKHNRYVEITGADSGPSECGIVVRDNGIGIPEHSVRSIFNRFTRAHADRDDGQQVTGMGLGLSIVEDCVKAMHGRITVHSTEAVGTTFVLTFPTMPPSVSSVLRSSADLRTPHQPARLQQ